MIKSFCREAVWGTVGQLKERLWLWIWKW